MLAEVATTEISMVEQPMGFTESAKVAKRGANTARVARQQLEEETGKPAVSRLNAKELGQMKLPNGSEGDGE